MLYLNYAAIVLCRPISQFSCFLKYIYSLLSVAVLNRNSDCCCRHAMTIIIIIIIIIINNTTRPVQPPLLLPLPCVNNTSHYQ